MTNQTDNFQRDLFLCHAHADKEQLVRPLADELRKYGVSCWIDEAEIKLGDHVSAKINDGLRHSRFVLVFVTQNFVERNWPLAELNAAFGIEARKGEVVVLPLLAIPETEWVTQFPLFAEKKYIAWDAGIDSIARQIAERVGKTFREEWLHHYPAAYEGRIWIRILTFGSRGGARHTVVLRWGPWRCKRSFRSDSPSVCLVQAKASDEFSVPLFLKVNPPANVAFGVGDSPCNKNIDISHSWRRLQI